MAKKTKKFSIYTLFLIMLVLGQFKSSLVGLALCTPAAVAPWFDKREKNIAIKVLSSLAVLSFALSAAFLGLKKLLLVNIVLLILFFAAYSALAAIFKPKGLSGNNAHSIFMAQMSVSLFVLILAANRFTFSEASFPFLAPSIALGVLIAGAVFIIFINGGEKKFSKGNKIGIFCIACFVSVFVAWAGIASFNYVLDFSEPQAYRVTIEDKDYTRRRKGVDSYEFTITADGKKLDIEVSWREFDSYEIGDTYTVNRYNGAFGEPFFIAD
jgi:hypothetical protein